MQNKLSFLAGLGTGYVVGARAGRTRYEQIKRQSAKAWQSEPVQSKVAVAQSKVVEAAETVKAKTPAQAHPIVDKAVGAVSGGTTPATGTTPTGTGTTVADASYAGNPVGMPSVPAENPQHHS